MLLRFTLAYALLSLLFSLLSWGQLPPHETWVPPLGVGMAAHTVAHALFGALAALPVRRPSLVAAGAAAVLAIDVDHLGWALGLPMVGRAAHSPGFALAAGVAMAALARRGLLGRNAPPPLVGAVAAASVPAHMVVDALGPERRVPLWAPFSFADVELAPLWGVLLLAAALLLTTAARATR